MFTEPNLYLCATALNPKYALLDWMPNSRALLDSVWHMIYDEAVELINPEMLPEAFEEEKCVRPSLFFPLSFLCLFPLNLFHYFVFLSTVLPQVAFCLMFH